MTLIKQIADLFLGCLWKIARLPNSHLNQRSPLDRRHPRSILLRNTSYYFVSVSLISVFISVFTSLFEDAFASFVSHFFISSSEHSAFALFIVEQQPFISVFVEVFDEAGLVDFVVFSPAIANENATTRARTSVERRLFFISIFLLL